MPEISVIIPCYNVEKYLAECLDSVLGQSFEDFEAICVNDGSTDKTGDILAQYANKDKRIKVITQENQGVSMARNAGLKVAQGKYIYFLDADDAIHSQCLEIAYYLAEKYQADLVCFNFSTKTDREFLPKYEAEKLNVYVTNTPLLNVAVKGRHYKIYSYIWTELFRKSAVEGIEFIPRIYFEDYPYLYAVLANKPKTVLIDEKLYLYTDTNDSSITHQKFTPRYICDYGIGIKFLTEIYRQKGLESECAILKNSIIPSLLRQQWRCCQNGSDEMKNQLYQAFAQELMDLKCLGMLGWRGHKFKHYLAYLCLLRKYGRTFE